LIRRRINASFRRLLRDLGYQHRDESQNPAYRLFLA
jgi:hypothetical protein